MYQNSYSYTSTNRVNEKQTLRNLHEKFPKLSLDDLFAILDCVILETAYSYNYPGTITTARDCVLDSAVNAATIDSDRRFLTK
jgi:hypothetical protein